jgi:hypothetical protein
MVKNVPHSINAMYVQWRHRALRRPESHAPSHAHQPSQTGCEQRLRAPSRPTSALANRACGAPAGSCGRYGRHPRRPRSGLWPWSNGEPRSGLADRYSYPQPRVAPSNRATPHGSLTPFRISRTEPRSAPPSGAQSSDGSSPNGSPRSRTSPGRCDSPRVAPSSARDPTLRPYGGEVGWLSKLGRRSPRARRAVSDDAPRG